MKGDIEAVRRHYEDWWERRNTEPVVYIIHPEPGADLTSVAPDWAAPAIARRWSNWQQEMILAQALELARRDADASYLDQAMDFLCRYAEQTGYCADGYPFLQPGLGPGVLTALLTGYARFVDTTVWFELDPPLEWDAVHETLSAFDTEYYEWYVTVLRMTVARLQDRFVLGVPDLGGVFDVLAGIRGTQNLLMDLIVEPDAVRRAAALLEERLRAIYAETQAILAPGNHGCHSQVMRYLSAQPAWIGVCDFSAMIGPHHFEEFCLPVLRREAEYWDGRYIYHMDGPGQRPHLDCLLSIEKLHAIQWVPGAGNPGCLDPLYYRMYARILDAGKRICFGGADASADSYRRFFKRFPKEAFLLPVTCRSKGEAEKFAEAIR
jgi:hypothetical protein